MKAIHCKQLFDGKEIKNNQVVIWQDDNIIAVGDELLLKKYNILELIETEYLLSPSFVDIQVNGAGGENFYKEGISQQTLQIMSNTLKILGCGAFCPTLISSSDEDIQKALDVVDTADRESLGVIGLHIEGPMFAQEFRGAHSAEIIRVLDEKFLTKVVESNVALITLAPEVVPDHYIDIIQKKGIKVSIGHTNAFLKDVRNAEKLGVRLATHLYNAMSRFQSREPNAVGSILTSKSIYSSIIPDGNHCHFESIKLAHKMLGDRLFVVTDAILALGTELKTFVHSNQQVFVDDQKRCINESGALVGSMVTPIECIQNLVWECEFSLAEALRAYTYTPAFVLCKQNTIGQITVGAKANFNIINPKTITLEQTYFRGVSL